MGREVDSKHRPSTTISEGKGDSPQSVSSRANGKNLKSRGNDSLHSLAAYSADPDNREPCRHDDIRPGDSRGKHYRARLPQHQLSHNLGNSNIDRARSRNIARP